MVADVTDEEAKKADLGVGELFLAPLGRLDEQKIVKYYCKKCDAEFEKSPKIEYENPNEVNLFFWQFSEGFLKSMVLRFEPFLIGAYLYFSRTRGLEKQVEEVEEIDEMEED